MLVNYAFQSFAPRDAGKRRPAHAGRGTGGPSAAQHGPERPEPGPCTARGARGASECPRRARRVPGEHVAALLVVAFLPCYFWEQLRLPTPLPDFPFPV